MSAVEYQRYILGLMFGEHWFVTMPLLAIILASAVAYVMERRS